MSKIKVGVFGAYRGMSMIKVLATHSDAELVAVCDKYLPALEEVKKTAAMHNLHVKLYEDFEDFFKHDMDAVVLANYAHEHAPFAVRLLKSGRHVMSEVLPCETMAQAVELIEAVEESGKVYAYAENYCYMGNTFEMWRRYENGEIGEIQYAEGEYIHDLSAEWPRYTYGERMHWRNIAYSTFYCTHSLGPILTITNRRPVQVVGFETNMNKDRPLLAPMCRSGGIEMVTLDNGAIVKSIHGGLKREPCSINYEIYGTKGMMETERWDTGNLSVYLENNLCEGDLSHYTPQAFVAKEQSARFNEHGGGDFYATHFFLEKILGKPDGIKYSIDVYTAVDMGICGILAYRSILNGNKPIAIPNLRNKSERDAFRNDYACTNPAVGGEQLLPVSPNYDTTKIPDEEFERIRKLWEAGKNDI